jgi:hypothetical protein
MATIHAVLASADGSRNANSSTPSSVTEAACNQ